MSGCNNLMIFVLGGAIAMLVSIVFPMLFLKHKPAAVEPHPPASHNYPRFTDHPNKKHHQTTEKQGRKSWGSTLIPYYSIGVFIYVFYIVFKIATQKRKSKKNETIEAPLKKSRISRIGGRQGTKITSYELNQLEEKLRESEQAVEKILQGANRVITEVYQREMENDRSDSSLSESSTDYDDSDTSPCTTVSDDSFGEGPRITELDDSTVNTTRRRLRGRRKEPSTIKQPKVPVEDGESFSEISSSDSVCSSKDTTQASCDDDAPSDDRPSAEDAEHEQVSDDRKLNANEVEAELASTGNSNPVSSKLQYPVTSNSDPMWLQEKQQLVKTANEVMSVMDDLRSYIAKQKA